MLKMEEIVEGVYRYGGELESPEGNPLVGVHLWYDQFMRHDLFCVNGKNPEGEYSYNLNRLLKTSTDRNIFLFEERLREGGIPVSAAKTVSEARGNSRGIYIVPTRFSNSLPVSGVWHGVCDFIYEISDTVDFAGGYLWNNGGYYSGCLGVAHGAFSRRGFDSSLVEGCCFTF